jgi:hypothetical protein
MGFAEALSDDGKLSGRGAPLLRGVVCGLMTFGGALATPCRISSRTSTPQPQSPCLDHLVDPVALHGRVSALGGGEGDGRRRASA